MSPSIRTVRWIGLASVFVFVAAAAFGAKLWHKTPRDFFLSLKTDSDTAEPTLPEAARDQPTGTSGSYARLAGGAASAQLDGLPPTGAASMSGAAGAGGRQSAAGKGWMPWGSSSARRGLNGSTASSGSASLGGLWHAMSPFGGHGGGAVDTPATVTARAEPAARAAKPTPAAKPAPKPSSPSSRPSGPPSVSAPSTAASAVPSTGGGPSSGGLGEHETPLPDVGGGSGGGGPIGGGGGGVNPGGGGSSPIDVSSNPEPGTIALVGTGLLGLIGAFRRRRA